VTEECERLLAKFACKATSPLGTKNLLYTIFATFIRCSRASLNMLRLSSLGAVAQLFTNDLDQRGPEYHGTRGHHVDDRELPLALLSPLQQFD